MRKIERLGKNNFNLEKPTEDQTRWVFFFFFKSENLVNSRQVSDSKSLTFLGRKSWKCISVK